MRRGKKTIQIGQNTAEQFTIGGDRQIAIQSMCNTKTEDWKSTVDQILQLQKEKCDLVRVSVPNKKAARALIKIKEGIGIPLIADIHFDYTLALESIKAGADKIRINPGNIGSKEKLKEIIDAAKKTKTPIRIGVNSGSLEKEILAKYSAPVAEALVESVQKHVNFFEKNDFDNIVLSVKTSDVLETIKANRLLAKISSYPLHVGITEAGTMRSGTAKNAIGIGTLLMEGIGDTIRVSISGDPVEEVKVAKDILKALNLYNKEPIIIACPTCSRTGIDVAKIAQRIEEKTKYVPKGIRIAIMGCAVNGPGEAKEADYAIVGGNKQGAIYKKGEYIRIVDEKKLVSELLHVIKHEER